MSKVKELEKQINILIEGFKHTLALKEHARAELSALTTDRSTIENTLKIVEDYPDFDSICITLTNPNRVIIKVHINPEELRKDPKLAHKIAKTFARFK